MVGLSRRAAFRPALLGRDVAELCVRIVRYHADQPGQVVAQPAETLPALECRLVHVERTVDLDLKAMALPGGIGIGADDLDALVGIVHAHAIAEPFQRLAIGRASCRERRCTYW